MCRFFVSPRRKRVVLPPSPPPDSWFPTFKLVSFIKRTLSGLKGEALDCFSSIYNSFNLTWSIVGVNYSNIEILLEPAKRPISLLVTPIYRLPRYILSIVLYIVADPYYP